MSGRRRTCAERLRLSPESQPASGAVILFTCFRHYGGGRTAGSRTVFITDGFDAAGRHRALRSCRGVVVMLQ